METTVKCATMSVVRPGLVLHLRDGERTVISPKDWKNKLGFDLDGNYPKAMALVANATIEYTPVAVGDDIGNGTTATVAGHKIDFLILSDTKSDLLCRIDFRVAD